MKTSYLGDQIGTNTPLSFEGHDLICLPMSTRVAIVMGGPPSCQMLIPGPHFTGPLPDDATITEIVDWGFTGWYPEYWEYAITREGGDLVVFIPWTLSRSF